MIGALKSVASTYFGNATAVRDFRSQLRGARSLWLWLGYLLTLIFVCYAAYSGIVGSLRRVSELQTALTGFYQLTIYLLAATVCIAAPGITAGAVTSERQRKSLDLIFSGPVRTPYVLIGKLIGGFRYLSMLLVLAVPVVSVSVVLGGATWADVLAAFVILLANGLVLLSFGLLASAISKTTSAAIISAYVITLVYSGAAGLVASSAFRGIYGYSGTGPVSLDAPWYGVVSPFMAATAGPTSSAVLGLQIPNWAIGVMFAGVVSACLVLGAASAMGGFGSKETVKLRIMTLVMAGLATIFLVGPIAGGVISNMVTGLMGGTSGIGPAYPRTTPIAIAASLGVCVAMTALFWPNLLAFEREGERKHLYDGFISFRKMFTSAPSGALPFLASLVVVMGVGFGFGVRLMPAGFSATGPIPAWVYGSILRMTVWSVAFLTLWWGIARWGSAVSKDLRNARAWTLAWMVVLVAVPTPIIGMIVTKSESLAAWKFHILYPLFDATAGNLIWIHALVFFAVGFFVAIRAERRMARLGGRNEKPRTPTQIL